MLEESASAIPSSIWASMNSWFTPTILFLLLNLVIATIAFTSTLSDPKHKNTQNAPTAAAAAKPPTSLLHRLKSISLPTLSRSQETPNHPTKPDPDSFAQSHYFFPDATDSQAQAHYVFEQAHEQDLRKSPARFDSEVKEPDSVDSGPNRVEIAIEAPIEATAGGGHFSRTKSDTEPSSGVLPAKLPAKMRKSASLKSAFGHFEEEEIVETRRPATVRERRSAKEGDEEVDAKADDFINRFKQQLKLQRMDSIVRYKDMIGRGK